jgi:hypothetical protein
MAWTLTHGGITKGLDEWGLGSDLQMTRVNQGADTVTVSAPGANMDSAAPFTFGDAMTITKDGVKWFQGKLRSVHRSGNGEGEGLTYEFAGPWWDLERLVFQQTWKIYNGSALADQYTSELFLGQKIDGDKQTNGAQVVEILDWAIARGVSLQKGTIDAAADVPIYNVRDITCAEAIVQMLRWTADVTWFDYSTTPPTFHARSKANLTAKSVAVSDAKIRELQLNPRHDLVPPAVHLRFKNINEINGTQWVEITDQKYPAEATGLELGASVHTIELAGLRVNEVSATLGVTSFSPSNASWWSSHIPWLNSDKISGLTISDVSTVDASTGSGISGLSYELLDGQVAAWMSGVEVASARVTATVTYSKLYSSSGTLKLNKPISARLSVNVRLTNSSGGTYTALGSYSQGEAVPVGLAQMLYEARSALQYSGSVELVGAEVETGCGPGAALTLTGTALTLSGLAVQQSVETPAEGRVVAMVGPVAPLGLDDMIELLRVNRHRLFYSAPQSRVNGEAMASGAVQLGRQTANTWAASDNSSNEYAAEVASVSGGYNVVESDPVNQQVRIFKGNGDGVVDTSVGRVFIALGDSGGKEIKLREYKYCDVDGSGNPVEKRVRLLGSEPYDPPA